MSPLPPLAGMDKSVVQTQAKMVVAKAKVTRNSLLRDLVWVQCLVHNNLVWKEGKIMNLVSSMSYDVMCDGKL